MKRFSPVVRAICADSATLDLLEAALVRPDGMKQERVIPSEFSPIAKIPVKVTGYEERLAGFVSLCEKAIRDEGK